MENKVIVGSTADFQYVKKRIVILLKIIKLMENKVIDAMVVADRLLGNYLGVKDGEEVLIVLDPETDMIMPRALAAASIKYGAEYTLVHTRILP